MLEKIKEMVADSLGVDACEITEATSSKRTSAQIPSTCLSLSWRLRKSTVWRSQQRIWRRSPQ